MKQSTFTLTENRPLTDSVFLARLAGDTDGLTAPGQFLNLRLREKFLRRPISVCDWEKGLLTLVYKTVGEGTLALSRMAPGEKLDLLTGLGNGFDLSVPCQAPLLVGGGVGTPPLYKLARDLIALGKEVRVILGFNTGREVFFEEEFRALGARVTVATVNGERGVKGFVTDALPAAAPFDYLYTCGPEPMLRALYRAVETDGQFSFEERMGCGFGACMGCSCRTVTGYKRICREGPVLRKEEILWK
ncbi:MAG: dihydroorotate dehydrogenase electron transfer subunit [Clostridia bacterium]|nr:dihydroorotate dehydrogenase electron transfer subunit [Clostridia bacterium]